MSPKPSLEPSGEPSGGCAGDFIAPADGLIFENLEDFDTGEPRRSPPAAGPLPEFVPPEYWPAIAGLQGYRYRADSDLAFVEVLESTCAEHGVTPSDVVQAFSKYYAARPFVKGWSDPVKSLQGTLLTQISKLTLNGRPPPAQTAHQRRIEAEKMIPIRPFKRAGDA